jgi:hypothetical protein
VLCVEVLGARVEVDGKDAGHVTGVLVDPDQRAIGLEVTSVDSDRRFLPLVAATLSDGVVSVASPLLLVESCDAYIARGATICRDLACLEDLRATASAAVSTVLVAGTHGR